MKIFIACCMALVPVVVYAQEKIPENATAFYNKAVTEINPKHYSWIKQTAVNVNKNNSDEAAITTQAKNYGSVLGLGEQDIMALAFLVMMEASKSAQEDLKAIMNEVKNVNKEKEKFRSLSIQANKYSGENAGLKMPKTTLDSFRLLIKASNNKQMTMSQPRSIQTNQIQKTNTNSTRQLASAEELKSLQAELKNKLDSLDEMSESGSLSMQLFMERSSRFNSTLSNIMKKIADTKGSIISNLK